MFSQTLQVIFWISMIPFWILVSFFGKRAMKYKIQSDLVSQKEVSDFARNFILIFCTVSGLMVIVSLIGGEVGIRLGGIIGFLFCAAFLMWLWVFEGIKHIVLFGPFLNMPLKMKRG